MSFSGILKEIVRKVDGAASAMIIGVDGMPIEEYTAESLLSLDDLGAEASQMIKDINNAALNLGIGEAREFSIISDRCGILMRGITPEYFLALILKPGGNYGKGRFVLRSCIPRIESEF